MATSNNTTQAVWLPTILAKEAIRARNAKGVLASRVVRKDSEVKQAGQVIDVPEVSTVTVGDVGDDGSYIAEAITESKKTITVNQWKYAAARATDMVLTQSLIDFMSEKGKQIGEKLGASIDNYIHDSVVSTSHASFISVAGDFTEQYILDAKTVFDTASVPEDNRFLLVSAGQANAILAINKFASIDFVSSGKGYGSTNTGKLPGQIQGFAMLMSTLVNRTASLGSPSATRTVNIAFHKEAFGLAVQKAVKLEKRRVANALADEIIGSCLFGASVLRVDHYVPCGSTSA